MLTLFDLLGTARHCLTLFGTVSLSLAVLPLLDLGDYLCWLGSSWQLCGQLWAALGSSWQLWVSGLLWSAWEAPGSSGQLLAALGSSLQVWGALGTSGQLLAALGSSGQPWAALDSSGQFWAALGNSW